MKIRECLVSNSSSSSFIVAFPKKPESVEELGKMMGIESGKTIDYYDSKASGSDVVARVMGDIKDNKKATKKQIAELLSQRYYYTRHDGNMFSDSCPYGWCGRDKYYGNDEKLLAELAKLFVEEDELNEKRYQDEAMIVSKYGMNCPKNYSELSENEQKKWDEKHSKWCETNKEYRKFLSDHLERSNKIWKEQQSLKDQISKIDAETFIKNEDDKYICIFEYSDNDGEFGSAMEHGEIFGKLSHIVVSHH